MSENWVKFLHVFLSQPPTLSQRNPGVLNQCTKLPRANMYCMWNAVYNVTNPLLCKTVTKLVSANPWHLTTGYSFHERTHGYTISIVYLRFHKQNFVKQMKMWR